MTDPYKRHRRLGRWYIGHTTLEDNYDALMLIQRQALIIEVNYDWSCDRRRFLGQFEAFDIVEQGCIVPVYVAEFQYARKSRPGKVIGIRWRRAIEPEEMSGPDWSTWEPESTLSPADRARMQGVALEYVTCP